MSGGHIIRVARWCGAALAGFVVASGLAACSATTDDSAVRTVTVHETAAPTPKAKAPRVASRVRRTQPEFTHCDANIEVKTATTTCGFAQNAFWKYWTENEPSSIEVYSPKLGSTLDANCTSSAGRVTCSTADNGVVRFSQTAVANYSQDQADAYAAGHDLGPDPTEDSSPPAEDSGSDGSDSSPPADETPGENIPSYDEGRGYRVQCADGMYSKSGGIQGACSGHGGVR